MGNINLTDRYKRTNEQHSKVNQSLIVRRDKTDEEIYSDVRFDIESKEITDRPINSKINTKDIQKITDMESVTNSLKNIFQTVSGNRILNPEMNIDLRQFLFEPINEHTAWFIGYVLCTSIPAYEPRVKIDNVNIVANVDDAEYNISLRVSVPTLGKTVSFSTVLSKELYS